MNSMAVSGTFVKQVVAQIFSRSIFMVMEILSTKGDIICPMESDSLCAKVVQK